MQNVKECETGNLECGKTVRNARVVSAASLKEFRGPELLHRSWRVDGWTRAMQVWVCKEGG